MKSRVTHKTNNAPMVTTPPVREIRHLLEQSSRLLVASHIDPDGDAIGSQLALAEYLRRLGKEVYLVREAPVPHKYRFLPGIDRITHIDDYPDDFTVDTAVVLECPAPQRVGRAARFLEGDVRVINLDHHYESGEFGTVNWIDPTRSSVGEMTFELLEGLEFELTPEVAEQLYTAIMTDTGRFRFQSTAPRTMEIVGRLIGAGADPKKITDNVYFNLTASTMKLTARVLSTLEYFDDQRICVLTLTNAMLAETGAEMSESDGLVDFTLFTDTVEAGALFKEQDATSTRVSLRSRDGINVADLAMQYGGGGHFNASGCTVPKGLAEAKQELVQRMTEARHGKSKGR